MAGIGIPQLPARIVDPDAQSSLQSPAYPLNVYESVSQSASPMYGLGEALGAYQAMVPTLSPLNSPAIQARTHDAYVRMLDNLAKRPTAADKGEAFGRNLLGGVIAPAMAIFGGDGSRAAAVGMLNRVNEDLRTAKSERVAEEAQHVTTINMLTRAAQQNALRPFSEFIKARKNEITAAQGQQKIDNNHWYNQQKIADRQTRTKLIEKLGTERNRLREQGIHLDEMKFGEVIRNNDMVDRRLRQLAALSAELRKRGQDMSSDRTAQRLAQDVQIANAKALQAEQEYNSSVRQAFAKGNAKTGKSFLGSDGKPLNPNDFMVNAVQLPEQDVSDDQFDSSDLDAAMQLVRTTLPPQAAGFTPASVPQVQASNPVNLTTSPNTLVSQFGGGMDGARQYWQALAPDQKAKQAENFKKTFGKYPWE